MYCRISQNELNPHSDPASLPSRLRALPGFAPPPGGWSRLSQRMQARRRRFIAAGTGLALAASVFVAVGLVVLQPQPAPPATVASSAATAPAVARLIRTSQRLERQLASARPQAAVWDSRRATTVASLESGLRVVDAQLTYADPAAAERLWRERVQLMDALVETHESQAPALHYASYEY